MSLPSVASELKAIILAEISHIQGFMQLLMKPRNGMPWSAEDRAAILLHLKHLAKTLPVLVIFTLPGGSLLLPFLAWFLDRRRNPDQLAENSAASAVSAEEAAPSGSPAVSPSESDQEAVSTLHTKNGNSSKTKSAESELREPSRAG
jgi:hypothetical protein